MKIFLVAADSSELHAVPGANGGYEPIFSPDGHTLAFSRIRQDRRKTQHGGEDIVYESATAWLANLAGGGMRRLTSWRNHLFNFASSFSPDGSVGAIAQDR